MYSKSLGVICVLVIMLMNCDGGSADDLFPDPNTYKSTPMNHNNEEQIVQRSNMGFDAVYPLRNGLRIVLKDGYYGVINSKGTLVLACDYTWIAVYENGIVARRGDKDFLYDRNGICLTKSPYQDIYENNGLFITVNDELYGVLNEKGSIVTETMNYSIGTYSCGWIPIVKDDMKVYYFDADGTVLMEMGFDDGTKFSQGFALVEDDEHVFLLDIYGNIEEINFTGFDRFPDEGVFITYLKGMTFVFDTKNKTTYDLQSDTAIAISERMVVIERNGLYGFFNVDTGTYINPIYTDVQRYSEQKAAVYDGKLWYYIDKAGNTISNGFLTAHPFSDGLAACSDVKTGLLGFIDNDCEWAITPFCEFDMNPYFVDGICNLYNYDPWNGYFIDTNGNLLWEFHLENDYFSHPEEIGL